MSQNTLNASVTRRSFIKGLGLLSATAAMAACAQAPKEQAPAAAKPLLAIIHTNDSHGHDVAVEATDNDKGTFSIAAVAALKTEWERRGYSVILVDVGDATQGTPLVDTANGASAITFMNACGYDLMTVGNHEFDWGPDNLAANEKAAKFPFLSANVFDKQTGKLRFTPNKVIELAGGMKVGVFGLTTPSTITTSNPKNITGFSFLRDDELYTCAQEQVDELRAQGCEIVVCAGHLGNETNVGGTSKELLERVKGIDLFLDGHDHEEVHEEVAGTLLVETGCHLHNIGIIVIDEGAPASEPVAAGSYNNVDLGVQAIVSAEDERCNEELGVVLGSTPFYLNGERAPGVRTQETNLGDFVADAFRWTATQEFGREVDTSIVNGGAIRTSIEEGDISLKTIKTVMPFSNELSVINVTGEQLLEAIEAACQGINDEKPIGAFPQVSNMKYTLDTTVPYEKGPEYPDSTYFAPAAPGARVTIEEVGGRAFSLDEKYSVATASFLSLGGDTYHVFKVAAEAEAPTTFGFDYEAVVSYLVEGCNHAVPEQYAEPQGRITIITE